MLSKEEIEDLCLQIITLSTLLEKKLEDLEKTGVIVHKLKFSVKNTKTLLFDFIKNYRCQT